MKFYVKRAKHFAVSEYLADCCEKVQTICLKLFFEIEEGLVNIFQGQMGAQSNF